MKISCPSCQSSYKIADEKVQGRTVKVRCRKCGLMIHVNEHGVTSDNVDAGGAEAPAASAIHDTSQALFSVLIAEGDQRDMSLQDVVAAYNSGQITADSFVWADGQPDWMPLAQVPAIVDALNAASAAVDQVAAAAPAPEPAAPAPAPAPVPVRASSPAQALARSSSPVQAPVRSSSPAQAPVRPSSPGAQPGGGLFGAAPAVDTPAASMFGTPAPAAAVREDRRGANVDLFGKSRTSDDDIATSAPAFAPIASAPKATGARDEQSVLFSLAALTAAAQTGPAGGPAGSAGTKDDSGLIDLKALANQPAPGASGPAAAAPVAILDAAPVLGTAIVDPSLAQLSAPEPVAPKKSYGLIIGIGVAVAGLAIAGAIVFVAMNKTPPPAPVATATETAAPTPTPTPTPPPPSTDGSAAAPATGGPPPAATPTTTAVSKGGGTKGGGTKAGGSKGATTAANTGSPTPPATTKAAPKGNKCGCAPADLACNMACAAK